MPMQSHRMINALLFGASLCFPPAISAADPLPLGHPDFVPSTERPVYYRPNNAWYPGATPPTGWHDAPAAPGQTAPPSTNILWKAPVPGWSLSHPIVVKGRVYAVGEPDFVTCWELETGKQLWQRRMMPLLCEGLPEDKAVAGQKVLDLARAMYYLNAAIIPHPSVKTNSGMRVRELTLEKLAASTLKDIPAQAATVLTTFTEHRSDCVAFADPALLAALDKDLAVIKRFQEAKDPEILLKMLVDPDTRPRHLIGACLSQLGVDIGGSWWGYVGSADSTLASDGQRIYGVFDQGQVFALDLDGRRIWAKREKGKHDNRGTFHSSPLLCNGLLLVRDLAHHPRTAVGILRALDGATGKQRWEIPFKRSNYGIPRLMRLGDTDVLISEASEHRENGALEIVRVNDGKVLGAFPPCWTDRGALLSVSGDVVAWGSAGDTGGGPNCGYRLSLAGPDRVSVTELWKQDKSDRILPGVQEFPTLMGSKGFFSARKENQIYEAQAGKIVASFPRNPQWAYQAAAIAGQHLIIQVDDGYNNPWLMKDGIAACRYVVVDIKDPIQPKVVSDGNRLGYRQPPADLIVSTYFKNLDHYSFAGCYKNSASHFALMSGPVPHGSKLLIQSSAFLYCIGTR